MARVLRVSEALPLTGERTVPGAPGEAYWFARHEVAYRWLLERFPTLLGGGVVVDAGSGEGYGAAMLAGSGAGAVLALELDAATCHHVRGAYPTVLPVRANLVALPLRDSAVDLLVSLQVVEHLWDLPGFLRECARVLRPRGSLAVTTPNRPVFSPGLARGDRPVNPFHVQELDAGQLSDLLQRSGFREVEVLGLHHGDRVTEWEQRNGTGLVAAQVAMVTGEGPVPADTARFVDSCSVADFFVSHDVTGAQDLVAVAVRP